MSKYPYISQVDQRDCGVAALAMILKHYGSSYSLAYLRELAQTSREGTSALGLVEAAKQLGLETQAIRADLDLFKQENLSYPFIVHVVKEGGLQHYYTVFGQIKEQLVIGDPDPSKKVIKMPLEEFAKEWTRVDLFFVPGEDYTKYKEDVPGLLSFLPILFRRKGLIAVIVLLSFLVTLVNIIGSYYLQAIIDRLIPQGAYNLLTMISLGGVIGTGLFLSSGYTIHQAGPLGAIIAYGIGSMLVYFVMLSLGELSVAMPYAGSFHLYAKRFIGPGTAFTIAVLY